MGPVPHPYSPLPAYHRIGCILPPTEVDRQTRDAPEVPLAPNADGLKTRLRIPQEPGVSPRRAPNLRLGIAPLYCFCETV